MGYSGNYSSNWLVVPMHVETKDFQISDIGTIYNTQTFAVRLAASSLPQQLLTVLQPLTHLHYRALPCGSPACVTPRAAAQMP